MKKKSEHTEIPKDDFLKKMSSHQFTPNPDQSFDRMVMSEVYRINSKKEKRKASVLAVLGLLPSMLVAGLFIWIVKDRIPWQQVNWMHITALAIILFYVRNLLTFAFFIIFRKEYENLNFNSKALQ